MPLRLNSYSGDLNAAGVAKALRRTPSGGSPRPQNKPEDTLAWQLRASGIEGWERQAVLFKPRRWAWDFYFPRGFTLSTDRHLLIDVQGGLFLGEMNWGNGPGGGRHNRGKGMEADMEKWNAATLAGYHVLVVSADHVKDGRALEWIKSALDAG